MSWASITSILLLSCGVSYAQPISKDVRNVLKKSSAEELEQALLSLARPGVSEARRLYLQALAQHDAQKAVDRYTEVMNRFPDSKEAANATLKVAQFYYSRGLYMAARRFFKELIRKYPESDFEDDATYAAASCLFAAKEYEACRRELKEFLRMFHRSPYRKIAQEDLKFLNAQANASGRGAENEVPKGNYALQIGAFSKPNHALKLRKEFEHEGFQVRVRETIINGIKFYQVLLNAFQTKAAAEAFGKKFKQTYGKPYRIVAL